MRHLIFFVMITCWVTDTVAQQLTVGAGIGIRKTTTGQVIIDSVRMEITNPNEHNYLVAGISIISSPVRKLYISGDLQIQPGALSIAVSDLPATACVLCTVKKGMLVSYYEIIPGLRIGYEFINSKTWFLQLSGGVSWNLRTGIRNTPYEELSGLSQKAIGLMGQSAGMIRPSNWFTQICLEIGWKKWIFRYQQSSLMNNSMVGSLRSGDQKYPLKIGQQYHMLILGYRLFSF